MGLEGIGKIIHRFKSRATVNEVKNDVIKMWFLFTFADKISLAR
jgi:hypothetical protein